VTVSSSHTLIFRKKHKGKIMNRKEKDIINRFYKDGKSIKIELGE